MNIATDYRAKRMRKDGAFFRQIARSTDTPLCRVRRQLRDAPPGPMRRQLKREIRYAGGLRAWWNQ